MYVCCVFIDLQEDGCNDILAFWQGMKARIPHLADIASRYLSTPVNSVDAERSFSSYNNVVSNKRHNLSDASTKMMVQLYYNAATSAASTASSSEDIESDATVSK